MGAKRLDYSSALTPRELRILELACEAMDDAQIAGACHISVLTVKHHVRSIYSKLGVRQRAHAVVHALRNGLVTPPWLAATRNTL